MPKKVKKGGQVPGEELPLRRHRDELQQEEVNRKREDLLALFLEVRSRGGSGVIVTMTSGHEDDRSMR